MNIQHSVNAHNSAREVTVACAPVAACNVYYCTAEPCRSLQCLVSCVSSANILTTLVEIDAFRTRWIIFSKYFGWKATIPSNPRWSGKTRDISVS